jgi:hypothetical protein
MACRACITSGITIAGFFILDCITSVLLVTLSGFYPSPP